MFRYFAITVSILIHGEDIDNNVEQNIYGIICNIYYKYGSGLKIILSKVDSVYETHMSGI